MVVLSIVSEPKNYRDAIKDSHWIRAMQYEIEALEMDDRSILTVAHRKEGNYLQMGFQNKI